MKKYDEIFNDDSIEKKTWILYPNSNVAIKRCDKSFFEGNSTGLPKQEICFFLVLIIHSIRNLLS